MIKKYTRKNSFKIIYETIISSKPNYSCGHKIKAKRIMRHCSNNSKKYDDKY